MTKTRLIQITDCHLLQDPQALFKQQSVYQNLSAIVADAAQQDADALLLTGDLAEQPTAATYQHFCEIFKQFPVSIYWLPGNHDDPLTMATVFNQHFSAEKVLQLNRWRIILLSSKLPYDTGEGMVSTAQLDFLRQQLNSANDQFAAIAVHHHVLPINSYMDKYPLKNAAEFLKLLQQYKNVKLVISGHVHQAFDQVQEGIRVVTTPATSYQLKSGAEKIILEKAPPAYRIIDLYDDGRIETKVISCPNPATSYRHTN